MRSTYPDFEETLEEYDMQVKVSKVPGDFVTVNVPSDSTALDAVEAARNQNSRAIGDVGGYEIRVNGSPTDGSAVLNENDTVLLTKMVKGNN